MDEVANGQDSAMDIPYAPSAQGSLDLDARLRNTYMNAPLHAIANLRVMGSGGVKSNDPVIRGVLTLAELNLLYDM